MWWWLQRASAHTENQPAYISDWLRVTGDFLYDLEERSVPSPAEHGENPKLIIWGKEAVYKSHENVWEAHMLFRDVHLLLRDGLSQL